MSLTNEYRDQINRQAQRLGLNTKELARRAGVARTGLSSFLNGHGNPSLDWIDKVLGALKRAKRPRKKRSG
ncbi:MAG: helix-turn-helix transcriptional regulator [Phycisphaerales bacterium]